MKKRNNVAKWHSRKVDKRRGKNAVCMISVEIYPNNNNAHPSVSPQQQLFLINKAGYKNVKGVNRNILWKLAGNME